MKKLLIMLMVVAMASFLFVGCLGTTPPIDPDEPDEPVVPVIKTDTPFITEIDGGNVVLYSTETQYAKGATVKGVGVAGAVIKSYINGVQAGVANSGTEGAFEVTVSMIKLTEGVKKLHVTATKPGLAESDASTEYTFTVDLTAPKIASLLAYYDDNTIIVTFNETVDTTAIVDSKPLKSALNLANYQVVGEKELTETDTVIVKVSSKVVKIALADEITIPSYGGLYVLACKDIEDTLGNAMATTFTETCIGFTQ